MPVNSYSIKTNDIVSPRLQLTEITSGEMFTRLVNAFGDISADKDNKKEISENYVPISVSKLRFAYYLQ